MTNPTETDAWKGLQYHCADFKRDDFRLAQLFENQDRFSQFSIQHENLLLDYSKNFASRESIKTLIQLAQEMDVPEAINAMFAGEKINTTEDRAALHTALRIPVEENSNPEIIDCLRRMDAFVAAIHSGEWQGYSGEKITDIVNIGIGGSDLGPAFVNEALSACAINELTLHFVSNIDPAHLDDLLVTLNPATSLFIVSSKSFSTLETKENAEAARKWLLAHNESISSVEKHFIAVTSNLDAATDFGIASTNLFPMWDWVGGRFSLWSAIGLPVALAIGMENFRSLLDGAYSMDKHFQTAELGKNIPVMMALLSVWYTAFFDAHSHAVIPYSQKLEQFPKYLQQLTMESLGKSVSNDNETVSTKTGNVLWGSAGTNCQHSFFQLLHQGTELIPIDFISVIKPTSDGSNAFRRHNQLLANSLGQSLALMHGNSASPDPHRRITGNKPSNTLLIDELNPYNLGSLIAIYEHKTYVQSVIWNINAFDQWGVELGKKQAALLFNALESESVDFDLDNSTLGLIEHIKNQR